jgi:hypothetical protein
MTHKIEILWHPSEDFEIAAQKGVSYNTTIIIDGDQYTISFIEFGTLHRVLQLYEKDRRPFDLNSFAENGLVVEIIQEECILKSIRSLLNSYGGLKMFPYLKEDN